MKLAGLILSALLFLLPLPLAAQSAVEATEGEKVVRAEVLAAFARLVDRGEARPLFGLPAETFWRRSGDLGLALFGEDAETSLPILERVAAPFAEVSGLEISVLDNGSEVMAGQDMATLAPDADLVIVVGTRPQLAEIAAANDFNKGMLARFELGTWPFMFAFTEDRQRRGVVLLADDEPENAREASFILATVWGLGGVTLGPELTGLVRDTEAGPELTPLGAAVFRLFFHEDLDVGMPITDAVQRAETLLPQ